MNLNTPRFSAGVGGHRLCGWQCAGRHRGWHPVSSRVGCSHKLPLTDEGLLTQSCSIRAPANWVSFSLLNVEGQHSFS